MIKYPEFLHDDTNSWKLKGEKYWGGCGQKWVWSPCSQDSKIDFFSRRNQ